VGLNKLYLLMEKQHNRGQDGAGLAAVKLNVEPGYPFMHRIRSNAHQAIADIFQQVGKEIEELELYHPEIKNHPGLMKGHVRFWAKYCWGTCAMVHRAKTNWNIVILFYNGIRFPVATW
jgi:amidophosphoribosyltransferase